jgi:hypothetical protein
VKSEQLVEELEKAAEKVGVKVSYETLGTESGQGGMCKVRGEWRVIVDRRAQPNERAVVLARALATFDLEAMFLPEKVREFVARYAPPPPQPPA